MAKELVKNTVVSNQNTAVDPDTELEDDSYESPFWFWVWMGGLALLFVAFGLINKYNTSESKADTVASPAVYSTDSVSHANEITVVRQ